MYIAIFDFQNRLVDSKLLNLIIKVIQFEIVLLFDHGSGLFNDIDASRLPQRLSVQPEINSRLLQ